MKEKVENLENDVKGREISATLEKYTKKASKVFIIGHKIPDFDSIGSAVGLFSIVEQLGKKAYIVIGDDIEDIPSDIKRILIDFGSRINVINVEEFKKRKDADSLLIMTDVNKKNRIHLENELDKFNNIIIVDHHDIKKGETVENAIHLIYPSASSASELVAQAMIYKGKKESKNKFKITKDVATLLYSGIRLDTDGYRIEKNNITHAVTAKLFECGADKEYVGKLFRIDRGTYNEVANLILNGTILRQYIKELTELGISFSLNRKHPNYIYKLEVLAMVSTQQIVFKGTAAAFTIGYIKPGLVGISARSSSDSINVKNIMEKMDGGGTETASGTQIYTDDIEAVEDKLIHVVEDFLSLQETPAIDLIPDLTEEPKQFKKTTKKRRKTN